MKYYISFILLAASWKISKADKCDALGVLTYDELGCKAVYNKPGECPSYYKCPKYTTKDGYCHFQGKKYKPSQQISAKVTDGPCAVACFCYKPDDVKGVTAQTEIICAVVDCREFFEGPPPEGCYRKHILGDCCRGDVQCPPINEKVTCTVDGVEYQEGSRFNPKGTCYACVCEKGFNGTYTSPYCIKRSCGFEMKYAGDLEKNCAPLYYYRDNEKSLCCPSDWICPSDNDVIKTIIPPSRAITRETCKFGNRILKPNEGFERTVDQFGKSRKVKCVCELPPFLTCTANF